jgi:hypothetical protein
MLTATTAVVPALLTHVHAGSAGGSDKMGKVLLDIPPRKQWLNGNGYCGEASVQQVLLYYGGYASQSYIRRLGGGEVLIAWNMEHVLEKLQMTFEVWSSDRRERSKDYLQWTKRHIVGRRPVIGGIYWRVGHSRQYDHIVTFVGLASEALDGRPYIGRDILTFADHFTNRLLDRRFDEVVDDRAMQASCASFPYCIPVRRQYGAAVAGIRDPDGETLPARLVVDTWDEPNVSEGENARAINAVLVVSGLTPGRKYAVLRYGDHRKLPRRGFVRSDYDRRFDFVASGRFYSFRDSFMSDAAAFYRVVRVEAD